MPRYRIELLRTVIGETTLFVEAETLAEAEAIATQQATENLIPVEWDPLECTQLPWVVESAEVKPSSSVERAIQAATDYSTVKGK